MDITHGGREEQHSFVMKEHMFDKVVTPSDVGKLNRLVIPKQHAQKYLPLAIPGDHDKGLLLSFEDIVSGKSWRFRYSYWSSSQSYVITKGWSHFVKEKGIGAGDTVSFSRGVGEAARHRLYIGWKRRPESTSGVDSCHGGQLLYLRLPCAAPRQAKRLRLFGVNLDMPEHSGGGDGCANYRRVPHAAPLLQLPSVTGETPVCAVSKETQSTLDLCL